MTGLSMQKINILSNTTKAVKGSKIIALETTENQVDSIFLKMLGKIGAEFV